MQNIPGTSFRYLITTQAGAADTALGELRQFLPDIRTAEVFTPELRIVETSQRLPERLFFTRHVFPVMFTGNAGSAEWQSLLPSEDSDIKRHPFSVQLRVAERDADAFALGTELVKEAERILAERGFHQDDKAPEWVVSLFITRGTLYAGVSWCRDNLSKWNGGEARFKKDDGFISRAEFKLLEAFEVFGGPVSKNGLTALAPGATKDGLTALDPGATKDGLTSLDLGAAPGGWTRALIGKGFGVTAVDPAEMHHSLLGNPKLTHMRTVAQRVNFKDASFNLIVNDMRMDMYDSARVMLTAAHALKPGGDALMTLKLTPGHWLRKTANVFKLLEEKYSVINARQLFHNRDEITVHLRNANIYRVTG
jgi:23S rRNA (cytidine2498-2'-O)-methyltransferase